MRSIDMPRIEIGGMPDDHNPCIEVVIVSGLADGRWPVSDLRGEIATWDKSNNQFKVWPIDDDHPIWEQDDSGKLWFSFSDGSLDMREMNHDATCPLNDDRYNESFDEEDTSTWLNNDDCNCWSPVR